MADPRQLLRQGVEAIRAGNKQRGRELLLQVVEEDDRNELAWLWLSATTDDRDEKIVCLENVLTINPENEKARQGLEKLSAPLPEPPLPPAMSLFIEEEPEESVPQAAAPAQAQPSADPDSWRKSLYEAPTAPPTAKGGKLRNDATLVPSEQNVPDRNVLDLFDAWASAIILLKRRGFDLEMLVAGYDRWAITMLFVALLAATSSFLTFQLSMIQVGGASGLSDLIVQSAAEQGTSLSASDLAVINRYIGQYLPFAGIAIWISVFLFVPLGQVFYAAIAHAVAGTLGGNGTFIQTLHGFAIAGVASQIVGLPFTLLQIMGLVLVQIQPIAIIGTQISSVALGIYAIVVYTVALTSAHTLDIFRAVISLIGSYLAAVFLLCCLCFAGAFVLSALPA